MFYTLARLSLMYGIILLLERRKEKKKDLVKLYSKDYQFGINKWPIEVLVNVYSVAY